MLTAGGTADLALQLVLAGQATLIVDSRVSAEYDLVTARPTFGFDERERRVLLDVLAAIAEPVVAPPLRLALPDAEDRMFVEVAVAGAADAIVTGNTRHFVSRGASLPVAVLTPRQFVERLRR